MVWYYITSYILIVGCMIYWSWRAQKAEAQVEELKKVSRALIEQACKIIELSDEIINEEVNEDGE